MTSPRTWKTTIGKAIAMGIAVVVSIGIIVFASPQLRDRLGIKTSLVSSAGVDQHDDHPAHGDHAAHDDHAGHDHGVDRHGDEGHDDHAGHDHAGHDHGTGSQADHGSDEHGADEHAGHDHGAAAESADDHSGHNHDEHAAHDGHSEANSIELSKQARKNLKLRTGKVTLSKFTQYIEVPGVVSDRPGKTHIEVTSPLTGVINAIEVSRGELVENGTLLFTLRLTHQDLVQTQESFLTQLGQKDVEDREIQRLSSIASGAVAGKTLINRKYERDKLMAGVRAARQSLLLHGLSEQQIAKIEQTRELVREVTVHAPELHEDDSLHHHSHHQESGNPVQLAAHQHPNHPPHVDAEFIVTTLDVNRGQAVMAGDRLTRLSDYSEVLIEGKAFQLDSHALRNAANSKSPLQAVVETSGDQPEIITGLQVVYIGNEIDRLSRALPFYVSLVNEIERSEVRDGRRYASWRYKPGQRMTIRIPKDQYSDVIVVPKDSVAEEGPERYVFVENSGHFDRVPVRVLAGDSISVAISNDGQLKPGQTIAIAGAHQLQMAMKNKSGGPIDMHAGHNH